MFILCWLNLAVSAPQLPKEVAEWSDWVLEHHPEKSCIDHQASNCAWLGELTFTIQNDEGRFVLEGQRDIAGWLPLPGAKEFWPVNVRFNNTHVPVLERNGKPQVYVPKGPFRLQGVIIWDSLPNEVPIPNAIGIVRATINGATLFVQRSSTGNLLLNQETDRTITPPILTVSRLWKDGPTPTLTTYIAIQNASKAQRVDLGSIDLPSSTLIATDGSISHWIDEANHLWAYAPSGVHQIEYVHALEPQTQNIPTPEVSEAWPSVEYWAIESDINHRQINIKGLTPLDAAQSLAPDTWRDHPSYLKTQEANVEFDVLLRGNPSPPRNTLSHSREVWPKLNENGFWIQDNITGTMHRDWAIQPPSEINIQSIEQGATNTKQSIVEYGGAIEIPVRSNEVNLTIVSDTSETAIPHHTWSTDFSDTAVTVWMPTAWTLLYWDGWLWGSLLGMLSNLGLGVTFAWKHRSQGVINIPYVVGVMIGGLIAPISTFAWQCIHWLCSAMHTSQWLFILSVGWGMCALYESRDTQQHSTPVYPRHLAEDYRVQTEEFTLRKSINKQSKERSFYTQTNTQTIQMGIGLPTWDGHPITKHWNNGKTPQKEMSLWILKPIHKRWLAIVAGILLVGLSWFRTTVRTMVTPAAMLLLLGVSSTSNTAFADTPDTQVETISNTNVMLPPKEVETLLLEHLFPDDCTQECVNIALANLTVDNDRKQLNIWMEVHAIEPAILDLPGPSDQWAIESVTFEGSKTHALRTSTDGFLQVRIPKGIWSIEITGALEDGLQLQWPIVPHRVNTEIGDWIIQGLLENGQIEDTIGFSKSSTQSNVSINHTGLFEWQQEVLLDSQWTILHTLSRPASNSKTTLSIPLTLEPNVQLLSPYALPTDDGWRIEFPKGQTTVEWTTVHPIEERLLIEHTSLDGIPTALTWQVLCSNTLHCTFEGPPPITHTTSDGDWKPTWHPYPGETLKITPTALMATSGETAQVQSLNVEHVIDGNSINSMATLTVNSSASQPIEFKIPEGAVITTVHRNNLPYPFQATQSLPLLANVGKDTFTLSWTSTQDQWKYTLPSPSLALSVSNPTIQVRHSNDTAVIWGTQIWSNSSPPIVSGLLLICLMSLGLARHPKSSWSFVLWGAALMGMAHTGWYLGASLFSLMLWYHFIHGSSRWKLGLRVPILFVLLISTISVLGSSINSIWFWKTYDLRWYTDFATALPTIEVVTIPKVWITVPWIVWLLWMLSTLRRGLLEDLQWGQPIKSTTGENDATIPPNEPDAVR